MRQIIQTNGFPNLRMSEDECLEMARLLIGMVQRSGHTGTHAVETVPMIRTENGKDFPSCLVLTLVPFALVPQMIGEVGAKPGARRKGGKL